jgi:hypothetical protein
MMNSIKAFLLAPIVAAFGFASLAQEKIEVEKYNIEIPDAPKKGKQRHAKITLINGQKLKGVITSIGDSSIQMEKVVYKNRQGVNPAPGKSMSFNEVYYSDIQNIKIRATLGESISGFFAEIFLRALFGPLDTGSSLLFSHIEIAGQYTKYKKFKKDMEDEKI